MKSSLVAAGISDRGQVRRENEDAILLLPNVGVFAVADGMGGVKGGAVASDRTLKVVAENLSRQRELPSLTDRVRIVRQSLDQASVWIRDWAAKQSIQGTGSTVVCLVLDAEARSGTLVHAGDSRAYRLRQGHLALLSQDHSMAAMLGESDRETVPPMFREMVTRAVGLHEQVDAEETSIPEIQPGDVFLLCSDGLMKMVPDGQIEVILNDARQDMDLAAKALVAKANDAGGKDNTSVVVVRVTDPKDAHKDAPMRESSTATETQESDAAFPRAETGSDDSDIAAHTPQVDTTETPSGTTGGRSLRGPTLFLLIGTLAAVAWIGSCIARRHPLQAGPTPSSTMQTTGSLPTDRLVGEDAGRRSQDSAPGVLTADQFQMRLEEAFTNGQWGTLDRALNANPGLQDDLLMTEDYRYFRNWRDEWSRVTAASSTAPIELASFAKAVNSLCRRLDVPPFSEQARPWPKTSPDIADLYCSTKHRLQQHLLGSLSLYAERMQRDMDLLGKDAVGNLACLLHLAGIPSGERAQILDLPPRMRETIASLERWAVRSRRESLRLRDVHDAEKVYVVAIQESAAALWTSVWKGLDTLSRETLLAAGLSAQDDGPMLDDVAQARREVVHSAGLDSSPKRWPTLVRPDAMERLLALLRQVDAKVQ